MPVDPDTTEPLKTALESMEGSVQSCKASLGFAAPEMQDTFWIELQQGLADVLMAMDQKLREGSDDVRRVQSAIEGASLLAFDYTNWKGEDHSYIIQPQGITWQQNNGDTKPFWYLHGWLVTRDGDARPGMGTRRRSFQLHACRGLYERTPSR